METANQGNAIVRYDNLAGAEVAVFEDNNRFIWRCGGCRAEGPRYGDIRPSREGADRHASGCRAKP